MNLPMLARLPFLALTRCQRPWTNVPWQLAPLACCLAVGAIFVCPEALGAAGELELRVVDADSGEPIAAQFRLFNAQGRLVRPPGLTRDGDWLVFDGSTVLRLPPGQYQFEMRRGVEYRRRTGHFFMKSGAGDNHEVSLPRVLDMAKEGWYSGDLHVHADRLPRLPERMLAADLRYLPAITWSNGKAASMPQTQAGDEAVGAGRSLTTGHGFDRRQSGSVVLVQPPRSVVLPSSQLDLPTPFELVRDLRSSAEEPAAGGPRFRVHLTRASAWDLPVWIAHQQIDSIGLLHDGLQQEASKLDASDRPADPVLYPGAAGPARWAQQIYFRLLDTGHRIAPAAGSGVDGGSNPLGYHRVYVHCGDAFSPDAWLEGLQAGRVMVTNGPLLRPRVNGQLPGHVFTATPGQRLELEAALHLSTQDKIQYLELIQNGRPVHQVRLEDWAKQQGRLPPVVFEQSGWMLIRAVADHPSGYIAAVTGAYFVEFDGQPRISREAAQFFLDWVYQRARQIAQTGGSDAHEVLEQHRVARDYWQQRLEAANVD